MRFADPFCQFLDYEIFLADEELVFDIDEVFCGGNEMKVGLIYTLFLLHQALTPSSCTSQELMFVSS